jgi:hypothetical protein
MAPEITWAPVLLFLSALAAFALISHIQTRGRKVKHRSDFRRMESPAARARRRAAQRQPAGGGFVR